MLFEALLTHPGPALSKAQLEERLYSFETEVESNTIEVHVSRLRKKLGAAIIETERGSATGWAAHDGCAMPPAGWLAAAALGLAVGLVVTLLWGDRPGHRRPAARRNERGLRFCL